MNELKQLERENAFYTAHKKEFHEKYLNKWLVIVGESLWGTYDKISDAAKEALKHFEPGNFMIHRPADDDMVIEIGPIVSVKRLDDDKDSKPEPVITSIIGDPVKFQYAY